jgi:hypothetical protein
MAGDWIKMRNGLIKAPQVVRIAIDIQKTKTEVLGALFILWVIADENSTEGALKFGPKHIDYEVGLPGFSEALKAVGWLNILDENQVSLPDYATHNGTNGKKRAADYKRCKDWRAENKGKQQPKNTPATVPKQDGNKEPLQAGCKPVAKGLQKCCTFRLEKSKSKSKRRKEPIKASDKTTVETIQRQAMDISEMAGDLARTWIWHRKGIAASELPGRVLEQFQDELNHGMHYAEALNAIEAPERKRTEYLWVFLKRFNKVAGSGVSSSLKDVMERMAKDPKKSELLGVAFNG